MNKIIKTLRRVRWGRVFIAMILMIIFLYGLASLVLDIVAKINRKKTISVVQAQIYEIDNRPVVKQKQTKKNETVKSKKYRLTSYYIEDGFGTTSCTGSGKCIKDFKVNSKGWYTYKGKLVVAAATKECLNSKSGACGKWNVAKQNRKYFKYYDEIKVVIDGTTYDAIVLDSCGASMYVNEDRIDLFVSNSKSAIDRGYRGVNVVSVFAEY